MPIEFKSNLDEVLKDTQKSVERALEIIGGNAETYAKALCPTDTGLLKNSITHVAGGGTVDKSFADKDGGQRSHISGQAPKDEEGQYTVYVGTNVEYAPFVELGHRTKSGGMSKAKAFIRPAMENHTDEYNRIFKNEVKPNQ